MTREKLSQLTLEDLLRLVEMYGVDIDEDVESQPDRTLIELAVFEAMREEHDSRDEEDAFPVSYHQQRFESLEQIFGQSTDVQTDSFEFPQSYNVSRIDLMLRDPAWAFCYWDISTHDKSEYINNQDFRELLLRLEWIATTSRTGQNIMEVPISMDDSSWYLNLQNRECHYRVHLLARLADSEKILASSRRINVPMGAISQKLEVLDSFETDALIFLSGIESLGERGVHTEIPQRILSIRESQVGFDA